MRPPGLRPTSSGAGAEVDALQADVMRFVAIIGLSLAAIFSLLQEAEQSALIEQQIVQQQAMEQHTPEQLTVEQATLEQPPQAAPVDPVPVPEPLPKLQPAPEKARTKPSRPSTPDPEPQSSPPAASAPTGFSLSFASEEALMELLLRGGVKIYAISGEAFWAYDSADKSFGAESPPSSYHEMEATTVPPALRNWMAAAGVEVGRWGVVLPSETKQALDRLMAQQEGGELLIERTGQVMSVASPSRQP